jgi:hypothetical protein
MPAMTVFLRIEGQPGDLLGLEAALRTDPGVKGASLGRVTRDPSTGEMGPVVEALSWTAGNKELLAGLAAAVTAWVAGRRTKVRIRVGKREIEISSTAVPDAESLVLTILAALQERDGDV